MRHATLGVLIAVMLAVPVSSALSEEKGECTCEEMLSEIDKCREIDWAYLEDQRPTTPDELEALLENLLEGTEHSMKAMMSCMAKSKCVPDPSSEDERLDACQRPAFEHYLHLAASSDRPVVRTMSVTMALSTYMDITQPPDVSEEIERFSHEALNKETNPVASAAILKMLPFYRIGTERIVNDILQRMGDPDAVVRYFASTAFHRFTNAPLKFNAAGSSHERARQLGAIRKWWRQNQGKAGATNP